MLVEIFRGLRFTVVVDISKYAAPFRHLHVRSIALQYNINIILSSLTTENNNIRELPASHR
jgi:hypothetical protein